jgi:hypothetical protein
MERPRPPFVLEKNTAISDKRAASGFRLVDKAPEAALAEGRMP